MHAERLRVLQLLATQGRFLVTAPTAQQSHSEARRLLGHRAAGILANVKCLSFLHIRQDFGNELNASYHWLVIGNVEDVSDWPFRLDSDLTVVTPAAKNRFQLTEAFRLQPGQRARLNAEVFWSSVDGLSDTWDPRLTARRSDVSGMVIRAVQYVSINMSESSLRGLASLAFDNSTTYLTRMSSCIHIIFLAVSVKYNMTVRYSSMTDPGQLNGRKGNEFLYGGVGLLDRAEVDVCSTGLYMTKLRSYSMDHTYPIYRLRFICLFLSTEALGSVDALIKPFSWQVWVFVMVTVFAVFTLHRLFTEFTQTESSWASSILSSIGTLTHQGFLTSCEWISFRVLMITFELFCLLMLSYYSGAVVKCLLRPPTNKIHSLQDLLRAPYKGVANDWFSTQRVLNGSEDALVLKAVRNKISPPLGMGFVSPYEGVSALRTRSYAFYGDANTLYEAVRKFSSSELCQLHELDLQPPGAVGVAMTKNLSIKEHLRVGMLLVLEIGAISRELSRWHGRRPQCPPEGSTGRTSPVRLQPVLPALIILLIGMSISACLCCMERSQGDDHDTNNRKNTGSGLIDQGSRQSWYTDE